jgi:hypothetical protein
LEGKPFRKSLKRAITQWVLYLPSALRWWVIMECQRNLPLSRFHRLRLNFNSHNSNTSRWIIKSLREWTPTERCLTITIFKSPISSNNSLWWRLKSPSISNCLKLLTPMEKVLITLWCLVTPLTNLPSLTSGRIQGLLSMLISGRIPSPCISQSMVWEHSRTSKGNSNSTSSLPNNNFTSLINRIVTVHSPLWTRCSPSLISRTSDKTLTILLSDRDKEIFLNTTINSLSRNSLLILNWLRSNCINSRLDRNLNKVSIPITSNRVWCKASSNLRRKTSPSNMTTLNTNNKSKTSHVCPRHVTR